MCKVKIKIAVTLLVWDKGEENLKKKKEIKLRN